MDKSEGGTVVRGLEEVKAEKGASAAKQQETAPREEKKPDGLDVSAFADDIGVKKGEGGFAAAQKADDSMVKDAPTINYVLPDFYKFCYNATLVAHNI